MKDTWIDRLIKLNCWTKNAQNFGIGPSGVEKKFKKLRKAYGRFLKKKKKIPSGSGREAVPIPRQFSNLEKPCSSPI